MNDEERDDSLERRLRTDADGFDPAVPPDLAERCLRAVADDGSPEKAPPRRLGAWSWAALPLAAGLLLAVLLEPWRPAGQTPVPVPPPPTTGDSAEVQAFQQDLLPLLTALLPSPEANADRLLDTAHEKIDRGVERLAAGMGGAVLALVAKAER